MLPIYFFKEAWYSIEVTKEIRQHVEFVTFLRKLNMCEIANAFSKHSDHTKQGSQMGERKRLVTIERLLG